MARSDFFATQFNCLHSGFNLEGFMLSAEKFHYKLNKKVFRHILTTSISILQKCVIKVFSFSFRLIIFFLRAFNATT